MEARRATRGRQTISASEPPPRARSPTKKSSPTRSSPIRKSPGRKSPGRKSPGRKSPGRKSPARKSPARKSPARKSPARKSPGRTKSPIQKEGRVRTKKPTATVPPTSPAKDPKEKSEKKSPLVVLTSVSRTPISISPLKRDLKGTSSIQSVSTTYSSSTRTTIRTAKPGEDVDFSLNRSGGDNAAQSKISSIASFIRRSISKNATPTAEMIRPSHSVSRSVYDEEEENDENYSKTEYSDNEHENYEPVRAARLKSPYGKKTVLTSRQIEIPREFGGPIGAALFLLLVPSIVFYLQYSCNAQPCRLKLFNPLQATFASISTLFDRYATGAFLSFVCLVHLLSAFPFGRVVLLPNDRGGAKFYFNSILAAPSILLGIGIAEFFDYSVIAFFWRNYLKFSLLSIIMAFALSVCCYVRARKLPANALNPYAKSGNFLTDFFLGREITPKWFGVVDIKLACYRTSIIATAIYSIALIRRNVLFPGLPVVIEEKPLGYLDAVKYVAENTKFDTAALFSAILLAIYVSDLILHEHHLASSFDLQQEGVGALLLLRYALSPFLLTIVPRYVFLNKSISIPIWGYAIVSILFLLGLIIKRASNSIKYQYRMNPSQTNLVLIDTVPTFQGRRLLLGRWWGRLRQPNYAGDIISLLAFCAPIAWKFAWPPLLCILLIVASIIHRAVRVNARNFRRYDSAWARYCSRVRHALIPKVF